MTPLQAMSQLIGKATENIKVMVVTSKTSDTTVAVEANGEREIVEGQYKIGTKLIISVGKVIGVEKQDDRVFYEQ